MRNLPLLLLCLLLQACTATQKGLSEAATQAFLGLDDIEMTPEQVAKLPYASMYLRIADGQQIFVVLGFSEHGQQKWITADQAILVTQNGRLVKTSGLSDNLQQVSNLEQDPLRNPLQLSEGTRWTHTLSWTEKGQLRAGQAVSRFTRLKDEVLQLAGHPVATRVWQEDVTMDTNGKSWRNTFWIDTTSGQVRKTEQLLGADYLPITTTILKPAKS